jgi:hypothetical protein
VALALHLKGRRGKKVQRHAAAALMSVGLDEPYTALPANLEIRMSIYKEQDMSISWYHVVGLGLDISGIVFIWMFSQKSPRMLTPEAIKLSRHVIWIEIGIFLLSLGMTVHLFGYFLS